MNYEAEIEAALGHIKLENEAERLYRKSKYAEKLAVFLRDHPDFQMFYDLCEKVGRI